MADVTISQLTRGTPAGNSLLPYSTGSSTLGVPVSAIFQTVDGIGSRIGIGTTTPKRTVEIASAAEDGCALKISSLINASAGIYFNSNLNGVQKDSGGFYYGNDEAFRFLTVSSEKMCILSAGNVGIGTSNPQTKLDVNGTIKATSFSNNGIIDLTWNGYSAGNQVITHKARPNLGGPFKLEAMFSHYGYVNTYGATYHAVFALGGAPWTIKDISTIYNSNNGTSGSWSVTWDGTDLVISKSAGSYNGQGYYWIRLTGLDVSKIS